MKRFVTCAVVCALLLGQGAMAADGPLPPAVSNPEMKAIFDADQGDREHQAIDWSVVGPADVKRLARTKELLAQGVLHTADDFWEASFVFQHSDTANDYLMAHLLAMAALAKGKTDAIWITSATLDRYLAKIGQKQVIGTQYFKPKDTWTQEPYDRTLVPDSLRKELGVESQAEQQKYLEELKRERR